MFQSLLLCCCYRRNRYISAGPEAPPAGENEFTSLISPSAVFLQTNVKMNPCFYAANMQSCKCELVDRPEDNAL